jgi:hypothetical protein
MMVRFDPLSAFEFIENATGRKYPQTGLFKWMLELKRDKNVNVSWSGDFDSFLWVEVSSFSEHAKEIHLDMDGRTEDMHLYIDYFHTIDIVNVSKQANLTISIGAPDIDDIPTLDPTVRDMIIRLNGIDLIPSIEKHTRKDSHGVYKSVFPLPINTRYQNNKIIFHYNDLESSQNFKHQN